jgi:uroporphyrinogen decarboxylase
VAIQGNLDPAVMYATPEVIRVEVKKVLSQFKGDTGHVFNLGHGITPDVDPENMKVLVDSVHEFSTK